MASPNIKSESTQSSLKQKMSQVVDECSKYRQLYEKSKRELEEAKARRVKLEVDLATVNRKLNLFEGAFEQQNGKLLSTLQKLQDTGNAAAECERQRRHLENRLVADEEKLGDLEQLVRESGEVAAESERKYDDISRKLLMTESEMEKAETGSEKANKKIENLEEDLKSLGSRLKSMQNKIDKAVKKEELFDKTIDDLKAQLTQAEKRGSEAEKTVSKLQAEVDKLQDEVLQTKLQCQSLRDESDSFSRPFPGRADYKQNHSENKTNAKNFQQTR